MKYYIIKFRAKPKGESGESCNSNYNLAHACRKCGTGAKLVGNLITKGMTKIKYDFFTTLDGDYLISEGFYKKMISMDINLINLKKVFDSKKNILPFYHLYTEYNFPRFNDSSEGLVTEHQCLVCKRNGYFTDAKIGDFKKGIPTIIKPLKLKYNGISKEFLESSDFFHTFEHLGISNLKEDKLKVIRYARPMLIVNEHIKKAFEVYNIKNVSFEKIEIE